MLFIQKLGTYSLFVRLFSRKEAFAVRIISCICLCCYSHFWYCCCCRSWQRHIGTFRITWNYSTVIKIWAFDVQKIHSNSKCWCFQPQFWSCCLKHVFVIVRSNTYSLFIRWFKTKKLFFISQNFQTAVGDVDEAHANIHFLLHIDSSVTCSDTCYLFVTYHLHLKKKAYDIYKPFQTADADITNGNWDIAVVVDVNTDFLLHLNI